MNPVDDPRSTIDGTDVFAEGEASLPEAERVLQNLTEGSVGTLYDGPGGLEDARLVSPHDGADVLNTALSFASDFEYEDRLDREEQLENLGFDNSNYGSGSVVQEFLDGHGTEGSETPVYLMAGTSDTGAEYAVVVDDLEPAIRSNSEEFQSHLILEGNMAGNPEGPEDVQEYARTVGGELSEAYQTVANL